MANTKVSVTDEVLDAYINRPLAAQLVKVVEPHQAITPNHLTFVSALLGTLGGVGFVLAPTAGAIALFLSMVVDCSDGQLARLRGGGSVAGRIWDGYADYWVALIVHLSVFASMDLGHVALFGYMPSSFERFLLVLTAGISMAVNAGHFDFYKQRFLAHTGVTREPESPEMFLEAAASSTSAFERLLLRMFAWYVKTQLGPEADAANAAARFTASDPQRVERFRQENGWLVRMWSFSGPTMHNGLLAVAALALPFYPQAFAYYCVFAIVGFNFYGLILWVFQRSAVRREGFA